MLDEGIRAGFEHLGITMRTVAYAEWESAATSQLIALMEAGAMDEAPVWCGDFRHLNATQFRGVVDCVIAGFPCQDLSVAGRRAGLNGKRSGLFFNVLDVADDCGARFVVLENVAGIASATAAVVDETEGELEERAASRVVGELAERGWSAEWLTLSASDVGASHRRARWFCFAWRNVADSEHNAGRAQCGLESRQREDKGPHQSSEHRNCRATVANAGHLGSRPCEHVSGPCGCATEHIACGSVVGNAGLQHEQLQQRTDGAEHSATSCGVADSDGIGRRPQGHGELASSGADRSGVQLFAPGPAAPEWAGIISASPWLAPTTEPGFRVLVNGLAYVLDESRAHQLRQVGNGVVPLQASVALVTLVRRAAEQVALI